MNFHHIGIIVKDLKIGELQFKNFSNLRRISKKIIIDKKIGVKILFLKSTHHPLIELISPLKKNSPISLSLKKNVNLINHIAYISEKFSYDIEQLKNKGLLQITKPIPAKAFKGKKVVFFLNKLNFIIEVIEK
jgi:methylmalonyl-CoA/ethylmalonyl-CoA epimerase